jgi:hypothetical protein
LKEVHTGSLILIDWDCRKLPNLLPLYAQLRYLSLTVEYVRTDRTEHGWHIIIAIEDVLTLAEIIAVQSLLGSDKKRELHNMMRCLQLSRRAEMERVRLEPFANILFDRRLKKNENI